MRDGSPCRINAYGRFDESLPIRCMFFRWYH
jgi:hypothetical protein